MSNRRIVLLGLLSGVATALVAGALVVAFGPPVPLGGAGSSSAGATASPVGPGGQVAGGPAAGEGPPGGSASPNAGGPSGPTGSAGAGGSATPSGSAVAGGPFRMGEPAPSLRVPQLGGGTIDLAALRGHPVWIEFMATWCPSCRDEFPAMSGFAARYAGQGLVVVAVDVREDEGMVAGFVNHVGATFPIGLDGDGTAAAAWGALGLPTHFFVDASGVIRDGAVGGIGPDIMATSLRTIMPGVNVTP